MVKQTKNNQFGEVFAIGSEFLESLKAVRSARVRESHGRKTIKAIKIRTFRARAREGCNKGAKTCNKKTACFRLHQMHTSRACARREPSAAGGGGSQNLMTLRPRKPRSPARGEKIPPERSISKSNRGGTGPGWQQSISASLLHQGCTLSEVCSRLFGNG